jgi:LysM repeat protein
MSRETPHNPPMKFASGLLGIIAGCFALVGCGNGGGSVAGNPSGTGPFDSRGNYVEAWADKPEKWGRPGSRPAPVTPKPKPETPAVIASVEQPPPNSVPVVVATNTTPKPVATTPVRVTPKPVATQTKPKPKPKPAASTRYVVKKGDTLYGIALKNKTTVAALQRANGISGSLIRPGQTLKIAR